MIRGFIVIGIAVEDMLPKDRFLRIHRSYIIAVDKIQKVDRNDFVTKPNLK